MTRVEMGPVNYDELGGVVWRDVLLKHCISSQYSDKGFDGGKWKVNREARLLVRSVVVSDSL